jgi:hypothetical protein
MQEPAIQWCGHCTPSEVEQEGKASAGRIEERALWGQRKGCLARCDSLWTAAGKRQLLSRN